MYKVILLYFEFVCLVHFCYAQDTLTTNDVRVIKAISENTIARHFNVLLNTIAYTGAENADIKEMINQSFEDSSQKIFLNKQISIADDISDPGYSSKSGSPELSALQYLNAFNTFYAKSDTNSVFFTNIKSSQVKKGKKNLYINVYFTSYFRNKCLSNPATPYKPSKRVAEIYIKKSNNNKWTLYISRISFFSAADTVSDHLDNVVIVNPKKQAGPSEFAESANKPQDQENAAIRSNQYADQARLEEKKRNYQSAINLYSKAIDLVPVKKDLYQPHIRELTNSLRIISDLDEQFKAGYYRSVIRAYSDYLKKPKSNTDQANSDYYLGRGKCYDKMGQLTKSYNEQVRDYGDALQDYTKSFEYDNDNLETIRTRADLYRRMNKNIEAITEFKTYLARDPSDITIYEAMSDVHMISGNSGQAFKDIDVALTQENFDLAKKSRLYVDKGILYIRVKDYSSAENSFNRAISLDSTNAFAFYYRGIGRIKANKVQSAASDFNSALKKGLDSTSINYPLSVENEGQFTSAHLSEVPNSINYKIGNIYLNAGKYDSAYTYLARSYQSDPANGYILYSMASCIYLKGNTDESLKWFERSFKTNALERSFVENDKLLRPLQEEKRFKDLKKKYL
ncbi:MAG: hypothetical protein C5B59_03530 [Bacteroidetes bacterium]|nr:MAG: hypothetical protein C5B59_03530 [Bacteroidota bacterium]